MSNYPIIKSAYAAYPKYLERLEERITFLEDSVKAGSIRNVEMDAVKTTISRAIEEAFSKHVRAVFSHAGKWEDLSDAENELLDSCSPGSVPSTLVAMKRVKASKLDTPLTRAMTEVLTEAVALVEMIASLKDKIVKGRAPSAAPVAENPNKIVRTCPCCLRPIAINLTTRKMVHHGYTRPGEGWQTASCMGIEYLSLEVSTDGLCAYINALRAHKDAQRELIANPSRITVRVERLVDGRYSDVVLTPEDKGYARALESHIHRLENSIWALGESIKTSEDRLENWTQTIFE